MNRLTRLEQQAKLAVEAQHDAQALKLTGQLEWLADDPDCPDLMRLAALAEELGEVARCIHDGDRVCLGVELSQLAGIALAWGVALSQLALGEESA